MSEDEHTAPYVDTAPPGGEATIPEPPHGPDIPPPEPDGPTPAPEVPDLPQIPHPEEPTPPASLPQTPESPVQEASRSSDDTAAPSTPTPAASMPTMTPAHPATPMPTVTPTPRPVPMPTATPRPTDVPPDDVAPAQVQTAQAQTPQAETPQAETAVVHTAEVETVEAETAEVETAVAVSPQTAAADLPAGAESPVVTEPTATQETQPAAVTDPLPSPEPVLAEEAHPAAEPSADPAGERSGDATEAPATPVAGAEPPGQVTETGQQPAVTTPQKPRTTGPQGQRPAGQRPRGGRPGGPGGRPGGQGGRPTPTPHAPHGSHGSHTAVVEPIVEPIDPHLWGRIGDDGVVYVTTAAGERAIGNWQAGDVEAGLAHFGRKFDDFSTEIALLEARLASGTGDPKATKAQAIALRESVDTLPAIGDLDGAAARLETVIGAADAAIAGASQARTAARAAAIKAKEALCAEAEGLAESTQWKATGDRLKAIVEEWRTIRGIDRKTDDALWKRFAKARDTFTRHRGSHFAELDKQRSAAKEAKEALIARAEALSDATEWGETAAAYRGLMEEWKAAGRAPRDVEDALWARFRAAQEKFFSRRNKTFSDRDAEFEANAAIKEKLLAEGETIDPAKGLDAAKAKLRSIQERWEAAGKVPRDRIRELDTRLRAIEDRVKSADDRHWRRTDPETSARVEQFRARVESYRSQAAKARAAGDDRKARDAEEQAAQWEEWLRTAQSAVDR